MGCGSADIFNAEVVAERIRKGLNAISSTKGAILYRGPTYWQALAPGSEGQVLEMGASGYPVWGAGSAAKVFADPFYNKSPTPSLDDIRIQYGCYGGLGTGFSSGTSSGLAMAIGSTDGYICWIPHQLWNVNGQDQFGEFKWLARGTSGAVQVWLGFSGDSRQYTTAGGGFARAYIVEFNIGANLTRVLKYQTGASVLSNLGTCPGTGTLLRGTLEWNSGSPKISAYAGGSLIGTVTDSSSPLSAFGLCGFGQRMAPASGSNTIGEFRAGLLSEV